MSNFAVIRKDTSVPSPAERERIIENLQSVHLFDLDKLLAWPDRLMSATWWSSANAADELVYSPALAAFLEDFWPTDDFPMSFTDQMEAVAEVLYLSKGERYRNVHLFGHEIHFAHDAILLLLDQQIGRLKTVYQLNQAIFRDLDTDPEKLERIDALSQADTTPYGMADWLLDAWLPAHILFYGRKAIDKVEAEKAARRGHVDGDARRFNAGGPPDLIP